MDMELDMTSNTCQGAWKLTSQG